jgi:D-glycero-D-manno-heptose 1,7-bisphosphate phosphatase
MALSGLDMKLIGISQRIHGKLRGAVAAAGGEIKEIFYSPHGPCDGFACRRPRSGLLRYPAPNPGRV